MLIEASLFIRVSTIIEFFRLFLKEEKVLFEEWNKSNPKNWHQKIEILVSPMKSMKTQCVKSHRSLKISNVSLKGEFAFKHQKQSSEGSLFLAFIRKIGQLQA